MRAVAAACLALFVFMAAPRSLQAWGMEVHRYITGRALDGLPAEIRPFFAAEREFVKEHSVDPDLWRILNLTGKLGDEPPNHFLDIDGLDETRPFKDVPRNWDAYVARYGAERANRMGRLPWRTEEIYDLLVARFRDVGKGTVGYAASNAVYLSAVLAHYIEDAHVPFHAVMNYDGQLTSQRGIHSRFETELVLRNLSRLRLEPVNVRPVGPIGEFVFDTLIEGEAIVATVLKADLAAAAGREFYDDAYFAAFAKTALPVAERRLGEAASAVASVITAAWTEAGKPPLPAQGPSTPARIRR